MRIRPVLMALAVPSVLLAACSSGDTATVVRPIDEILASEIVVVPDESGTAAILRVETEIPVACAVVYGPGEGFGAIATDDDMAGGAHRDHAPQMTGLQPDTQFRYRLQGSDAEGNLYRSEVMTFRTPEASAAETPGSNVAIEAEVAAVSSEFSDGFAAANAVDGDAGTEWSTAGDGDDASITLDLGNSTEIVAVRWRTRQMSDGSAIVRRYGLTADGETFGPFPADEIAHVQVTGRELLFEATETTGGNTGAVEIEVFAADAS